MLAVIPYTTFPIIALGPLELRTFGLMVGLGVLVGAWVAARYIEAHAKITRDDVYRMATRLVIAGVIGARITWVITHWSEIESPIDVIAVWNGGLQFSGGFIAAVLVGMPTFRRWTRVRALDQPRRLRVRAHDRPRHRSHRLHLGRRALRPRQLWLLAVRYDGGSVREGTLGPNPLEIGSEFHNTAIYELLWMLLLFGILTLLIRRKPAPGTLMGVFCLYYGVARGLSDFLRVNDETVARPHGRAVDVRRCSSRPASGSSPGSARPPPTAVAARTPPNVGSDAVP